MENTATCKDITYNRDDISGYIYKLRKTTFLGDPIGKYAKYYHTRERLTVGGSYIFHKSGSGSIEGTYYVESIEEVFLLADYC